MSKEKEKVSVGLEREDWEVVRKALIMFSLLAHEFEKVDEKDHALGISSYIGLRLWEELPLEERLKVPKPLDDTEVIKISEGDELPF